MKLIDSHSLENVEQYVRSHARDFELDFRLESYSCKMVSNDKKEWRKNYVKIEPHELQPLSPPEESCLSQWSFGNFNSSGRLRHSSEVSYSGGSDNDIEEPAIVVGAVSRRTLFNLVAVLNHSYSDYDFSQAKSDRFTLANLSDCVRNIESKFSTAMPDYFAVKDQFWRAIDDEIKIDESILFSYITDFSDDPYATSIWSFNYFFWNRQLKRVLFLSCRALGSEGSEESEANEEGQWIGVN